MNFCPKCGAARSEVAEAERCPSCGGPGLDELAKQVKPRRRRVKAPGNRARRKPGPRGTKTVSQIVNTTRNILSTERDLEKITLARISKEAGRTANVILNYFKDTSGSSAISAICAHIATETSAEYLALVRNSLREIGEGSVRDTLPKIITRLVHDLERTPLLHVNVLALLSARQRYMILDQSLQSHVNSVTTYLARRADEIEPPPEVAALLLVHAAAGVGLAVARQPMDPARRKNLTQYLIKFALASVGAVPM